VWNWSILDTSGTETSGTVSAGAPAAGTVLVVGASIETLTAAAKTLALDEFGMRYARAGVRKYLGG
jgi:MinD-like ATPase involved in chromosome partitioning or flagellar assembly